MSDRTSGQNGHVVSALQDANDSTAGVCLSHLDDLPRQNFEIFHLQTEIANRILAMSVEACTDEDKLGLDPVR
jgi:hypothetical protein